MDNQITHPEAKTTKKILILEDEPFIRELYVRALNKAGYQSDLFRDGQKALDAAITNKYDIILLDIMVPNLMGTEILTKLRDPKVISDLKAKIIITTNLEMSEEDRAPIEAKADGYLIKADITPKELVAYLDQLQLNK